MQGAGVWRFDMFRLSLGKWRATFLLKKNKMKWKCSTALKINVGRADRAHMAHKASLSRPNDKKHCQLTCIYDGRGDVRAALRDLCISAITKFQETERTRHGPTTDTSERRQPKIERQRYSAIQTQWHNENLWLYYPQRKKYCANIHFTPHTRHRCTIA